MPRSVTEQPRWPGGTPAGLGGQWSPDGLTGPALEVLLGVAELVDMSRSDIGPRRYRRLRDSVHELNRESGRVDWVALDDETAEERMKSLVRRVVLDPLEENATGRLAHGVLETSAVNEAPYVEQIPARDDRGEQRDVNILEGAVQIGFMINEDLEEEVGADWNEVTYPDFFTAARQYADMPSDMQLQAVQNPTDGPFGALELDDIVVRKPTLSNRPEVGRVTSIRWDEDGRLEGFTYRNQNRDTVEITDDAAARFGYDTDRAGAIRAFRMPDPERPHAGSPGRTDSGRIRRFGSMTDEHLLEQRAHLLAHARAAPPGDTEAWERLEAEIDGRGLRDQYPENFAELGRDPFFHLRIGRVRDEPPSQSRGPEVREISSAGRQYLDNVLRGDGSLYVHQRQDGTYEVLGTRSEDLSEVQIETGPGRVDYYAAVRRADELAGGYNIRRGQDHVGNESADPLDDPVSSLAEAARRAAGAETDQGDPNRAYEPQVLPRRRPQPSTDRALQQQELDYRVGSYFGPRWQRTAVVRERPGDELDDLREGDVVVGRENLVGRVVGRTRARRARSRSSRARYGESVSIVWEDAEGLDDGLDQDFVRRINSGDWPQPSDYGDPQLTIWDLDDPPDLAWPLRIWRRDEQETVAVDPDDLELNDRVHLYSAAGRDAGRWQVRAVHHSTPREYDMRLDGTDTTVHLSAEQLGGEGEDDGEGDIRLERPDDGWDPAAGADERARRDLLAAPRNWFELEEHQRVRVTLRDGTRVEGRVRELPGDEETSTGHVFQNLVVETGHGATTIHPESAEDVQIGGLTEWGPRTRLLGQDVDVGDEVEIGSPSGWSVRGRVTYLGPGDEGVVVTIEQHNGDHFSYSEIDLARFNESGATFTVLDNVPTAEPVDGGTWEEYGVDYEGERPFVHNVLFDDGGVQRAWFRNLDYRRVPAQVNGRRERRPRSPERNAAEQEVGDVLAVDWTNASPASFGGYYGGDSPPSGTVPDQEALKLVDMSDPDSAGRYEGYEGRNVYLTNEEVASMLDPAADVPADLWRPTFTHATGPGYDLGWSVGDSVSLTPNRHGPTHSYTIEAFTDDGVFMMNSEGDSEYWSETDLENTWRTESLGRSQNIEFSRFEQLTNSDRGALESVDPDEGVAVGDLVVLPADFTPAGVDVLGGGEPPQVGVVVGIDPSDELRTQYGVVPVDVHPDGVPWRDVSTVNQTPGGYVISRPDLDRLRRTTTVSATPPVQVARPMNVPSSMDDVGMWYTAEGWNRGGRVGDPSRLHPGDVLVRRNDVTDANVLYNVDRVTRNTDGSTSLDVTASGDYGMSRTFVVTQANFELLGGHRRYAAWQGIPEGSAPLSTSRDRPSDIRNGDRFVARGPSGEFHYGDVVDSPSGTSSSTAVRWINEPPVGVVTDSANTTQFQRGWLEERMHNNNLPDRDSSHFRVDVIPGDRVTGSPPDDVADVPVAARLWGAIGAITNSSPNTAPDIAHNLVESLETDALTVDTNEQNDARIRRGDRVVAYVRGGPQPVISFANGTDEQYEQIGGIHEVWDRTGTSDVMELGANTVDVPLRHVEFEQLRGPVRDALALSARRTSRPRTTGRRRRAPSPELDEPIIGSGPREAPFPVRPHPDGHSYSVPRNREERLPGMGGTEPSPAMSAGLGDKRAGEVEEADWFYNEGPGTDPTNRMFGIEDELTGISIEEAQRALSEAGLPVDPRTNYFAKNFMAFAAKQDVSLDSSNDPEAVTPPLFGDAGFELARQMFEVLLNAGARQGRQDDYGLHCHQDARDMSMTQRTAACDTYQNNRDFIEMLVPPTRRAPGAATLAGPGVGAHHSDYVEIINDPSADTVEFRRLGSDLNFAHVEGWIMMLMMIMNQGKQDGEPLPKAQSLSDFLNKLDVPPAYKRRLLSRASQLQRRSR